MNYEPKLNLSTSHSFCLEQTHSICIGSLFEKPLVPSVRIWEETSCGRSICRNPLLNPRGGKINRKDKKRVGSDHGIKLSDKVTWLGRLGGMYSTVYIHTQNKEAHS